MFNRENFISRKIRTPLMGALLLCGIGFSMNLEAYQVSGGGGSLRVIQSGENSGSSSFQVKARLLPIASPERPIDTPATPVVTPGGAPTFTPSPNTSPQGGGGGGRSSNWYLQQKYDELVKEAEDFLTSAPLEASAIDKKKALAPPAIKPVEQLVEAEPKNTQPVNFRPAEQILTGRDLLESSEYRSSASLWDDNVSYVDHSHDEDCDENFHGAAPYVIEHNSGLGLLWLFVFAVLMMMSVMMWMMYRREQRLEHLVVPFTANTRYKPTASRFVNLNTKIYLLLLAFLPFVNTTYAVETTPQRLIYEGELSDNFGNALTGSYDFRFSLWDNQDFEDGVDVVAGIIDGARPDYFGWEELQTQTLGTNGRFSFQLGEVTPFTPNLFDRTAISLQIEVKPTANPVTSFEIIDLDLASTTVDRMVIDTVPFAFNADKLDFRDAGYGLGEIPYIDETTGLLPEAIIPLISTVGAGGNSFTIDLDGDALATDILTLAFGDTLGKTLVWDGVDDRFEFNDTVAIDGDLLVSGTINGVTLGLQDFDEVFSPRYPNSVFEADGTNNERGYMYEEEELVGGINKSIIHWGAKPATVQDYDLVLRYQLPENFDSFRTPALSLDYQTDATVLDAKIDMMVTQEGGSGSDELLLAGQGLNSNTWNTQSFTLNPATTWTRGDIMIVRIKFSSRNLNSAKIGDIKFHMRTE